MAHTYGRLSEQAAEDSLHAERLLHIEERPFQRVTRRLLGEESLLRSAAKSLPSPPPEDEENKEPSDATETEAFRRQKFREDVLIDFAALESSITRIQLIQSSNARERERYAAKRADILATAQSVRDNTLYLREQLVEAQNVLQLRKGYDELATKILDDKKLKSREEAKLEIETLEKDIDELDAECLEVDELWDGRKDAFEKFVTEGEAMMRVIKGIKEQPEDEEKPEDEAMDDGEEGSKDLSRLGTPGAEGGRTPRIEIGNGTPLRNAGGAPNDGSDDNEQRARNRLLEVEDATRTSSMAASPARETDATGDIEMESVVKRSDDELAEQAQVLTDGEAQSQEAMGEVDAMETMDES